MRIYVLVRRSDREDTVVALVFDERVLRQILRRKMERLNYNDEATSWYDESSKVYYDIAYIDIPTRYRIVP